MAKGKRPEITLPKLDDLFSSQESREEESLSKIRDIPLEMIDDFPDHPFKVKDDEDMMHLVESVIEHGILVPAILRMKEDGRYELIAGHRRKRACQLAGLETLRSEVVDLDRDEATIYMVDSNLQRTTILPSEKAFSYKMRLEAMKRQGKRSDLTSTPLVSKFRTDEKIGKDVGESREQIRRYIRLTELIAPILEMVDDGKIALRPAVEISYLPEELQYELFGSMEQEDCTPSHAQTVRMRKLLDEGKLTAESIYAILSEEKPNQKERLVLREDRIVNLIPPSIPMAKREDYIIKALTYYAKYRERNREDEKDSR
ncbi:MAG: ParB/RepB/Spo0J family partition protein [Firmicutes bacterium]|nr:ParB/RepB/Spo0J family partition protein [Bacillota bacterium]